MRENNPLLSRKKMWLRFRRNSFIFLFTFIGYLGRSWAVYVFDLVLKWQMYLASALGGFIHICYSLASRVGFFFSSVYVYRLNHIKLFQSLTSGFSIAFLPKKISSISRYTYHYNVNSLFFNCSRLPKHFSLVSQLLVFTPIYQYRDWACDLVSSANDLTWQITPSSGLAQMTPHTLFLNTFNFFEQVMVDLLVGIYQLVAKLVYFKQCVRGC